MKDDLKWAGMREWRGQAVNRDAWRTIESDAKNIEDYSASGKRKYNFVLY